MKENDIINGFEVTRVRENKEINGKLWELVHIRTGLKAAWLDNGENNKLFSINFKTVPWDDTGVFHILEHSVLGGSESFPVKEPFVELIKSSMNTFLNAMTFSDKTIFPVSSRNEKDFLNLVKAYLDGVFKPAIYYNPNIFYQEGWHYELMDRTDEPVYKGVVFNEMKGVYSSEESVLLQNIQKLMFPDTCYGFSSGGIPSIIPELNYDKFIAAHKEYYHPSNAKVYLDGSVPLEKVLKMMDEEYLCNYSGSDISHDIPMQKPVKNAETVGYYEASEGNEAKALLGLSKIICDWRDQKKTIAYDVLCNYMTATNESPIKKALLDQGLAQDVEMFVDDSIQQPYVIMIVKQIDYDKKNQIIAAIRGAIDGVLNEGFDKEKLHSILDYLYFESKDVEEPKGLERNVNAMRTWNYGGDPLDGLLEDGSFDDLRKAIDSDYYESLLREFPCDDTETVAHYLLPSLTKGEEDYQAEKERLAEAKNSWTEKEMDDILAMNEKLAEWQNSADSLEAINSLPKLALSDIGTEPAVMKTEAIERNGITVLKHECDESGIVHYQLYFSLADCDEEEFPAISFMSNLLGMIPTEKYSAIDLEKRIGRNMGYIDYNIKTFGSQNSTDICKPYFVVSLSVLEEREKDAIDLLGEILSNTLYSSAESRTMIKNILQQCIEIMRQEIMMSGNRYGLMEVQSQFSSAGAATEMTEGFSFYKWMKAFDENFDAAYGDFVRICERVQNETFDANHLVVSIASKRDEDDVSEIADVFSKNKPAKVPESKAVHYSNAPQREAIQIPGGISYAVSAGNLHRLGYAYSSEMDVLSTILSFDYLWNEVRVKGGAYGCGFSAGAGGGIGFSSYRDPDPLNSIDVYNNAAAYIERFCKDEEPLDKYVISTAASQEPLKQARILAEYADTDYFRGIRYEDRVEMRRHILQMKKSDLLKYADLMNRVSQQKAYCVVGNEQAIAKCRDEGWTVESL